MTTFSRTYAFLHFPSAAVEEKGMGFRRAFIRMVQLSFLGLMTFGAACSSIPPSSSGDRAPASARVLSPFAKHEGPEFVCRIEMQYPRNPANPGSNWRERPYSVCTGTLVSPTEVLTAGHCFASLLTETAADMLPRGAIVRCGYRPKKGAFEGIAIGEKGETSLTPDAFTVSVRAKSVVFDQRFEKVRGQFERYSDTGAWDMAILRLERAVTEVKPAEVLSSERWAAFASEFIEAPVPKGIFQDDVEAKVGKTIVRKAFPNSPGFNPQNECLAVGYGYDLAWKNERLQSIRIPAETTGVRYTTPSSLIFTQTFQCSDAVRLSLSTRSSREGEGCPSYTPIPSMGMSGYEALRGENIKRIYDRFPQAWDASWGDSGSPLLCRANSADSWKVFGVLAGGTTERRIDLAGVDQTISIETYYTTTLGFKPGSLHAF